MNTQISTKLVALTAALVMNTMMLGSVAYLFNGQLQPGSPSYAHNVIALVVKAKV